MSAAAPGWSADGNWFWDGRQWNDAVSADGRWRFDGSQWAPYEGQRSPAPAPPMPAAADPNLPSWVDQSEVERLAREKQERQLLAAQAALPQAPLPPELDWRRVGEHMKFHTQEREAASWQYGPLSVFIFLVLWSFCLPAALFFITRTAWRFSTKVIVAAVAFGLPLLFVFWALANGGLRQ